MYLVKPTITGALPRHARRSTHRVQLTVAILALITLGIVAVLSTSVLSVVLLMKALWNLAGMGVVVVSWVVLARVFVCNFHDACVRRFVQQVRYVIGRTSLAVLSLVAAIAIAHTVSRTPDTLRHDLVLFTQSLAIATLIGVGVAWLVVLVNWLRG